MLQRIAARPRLSSCRGVFWQRQLEKDFQHREELLRKDFQHREELQRDRELVLRKDFQHREELLRKDFQHSGEVAATKLMLVSVLQRSALSRLLRDAIDPLKHLVKTDKEEKDLARGRMSEINALARQYWPELGQLLLPSYCGEDGKVHRLPDYSYHGVLYGSLSDEVHHPNLRAIYVPDRLDERTKLFWSAVAAKYSLITEEISTADAARYMPDDDE